MVPSRRVGEGVRLPTRCLFEPLARHPTAWLESPVWDRVSGFRECTKAVRQRRGALCRPDEPPSGARITGMPPSLAGGTQAAQIARAPIAEAVSAGAVTKCHRRTSVGWSWCGPGSPWPGHRRAGAQTIRRPHGAAATSAAGSTTRIASRASARKTIERTASDQIGLSLTFNSVAIASECLAQVTAVHDCPSSPPNPRAAQDGNR